MEKKFNRFLTIIMVVAVIAFIGLFAYWLFDNFETLETENSAEAAIEEFERSISESLQTANIPENQEEYENVENPYEEVEEESTATTEKATKNSGTSSKSKTSSKSSNGSSSTPTRKMYKGFPMVGYIQIPRTGIKLPVLEYVTAQSIQKSVAMLTGPGLNMPGNTVIVGHNYKNKMFFSRNDEIRVDDKIYITDETGTKLTYTVYNTYITSPEDGEYIARDTNGEIEISLSTCTDDNSGRVIIWAKAD